MDLSKLGQHEKLALYSAIVVFLTGLISNWGGLLWLAVLAAIGCETIALESASELAKRAGELGIKTVEGPLEDGHKSGAAYDLILIDGAVEFIPDAIIAQLADGGRLGAALAEGGITRLIVGQKVGGAFGFLSIGDAGVAPLPGFTKPRGFRFER